MLVELAVPGEQVELMAELWGGFVDRDELLVQMIEGGPGRSQPVLEYSDVLRVRLPPQDVLQCRHGQIEVRRVLIGREGARGRELRRGRCVIDHVTTRDDDVVRSADEVERCFLNGRCRLRGRGAIAASASICSCPTGSAR